MKALPSIAFGGFRGTASDVTARQVGGRTVLNGRAQHSHVKTPKQSYRRAGFSFVARQYRTLTQEQQQEWAALAEKHRETALIGDGAPLTGHNLFVCLNTNRTILGVPVTKDAPANIHGSHYVAYDDIWITPSKLLISGLRDPASPFSRLVVRMASTDSPAVTRAWGKTVIMADFRSSDWGDADMTEIYTEQFGVPIIVGHKYFIEMYWIDELSGYVSEITRVCYPAVESESIHGREYTDRATIKQPDIINTTDSESLAFDMEISPGSKLVSADITVERVSGFSAGFAFKCDSIPDSASPTMSFFWSRGCADIEGKYFIGGLEMYINNRPYGEQITISKRAGYFSKKAEVFGTTLMIPW